jgi:two-component system phosphate regulon response regulator PhoB
MAALRTVLFADADADVRNLVTFVLARDGLSAILAADGEEALVLARRYRPDLILLDVLMPVLDGIAICRALKADPATAAIPVVVLTGEAQRELRGRALRAGADAYLTKPFSPAQLVAAVRRLLPH